MAPGFRAALSYQLCSKFPKPSITDHRQGTECRKTIDDFADALNSAGKKVIYFTTPRKYMTTEKPAAGFFWAIAEQFLAENLGVTLPAGWARSGKGRLQGGFRRKMDRATGMIGIEHVQQSKHAIFFPFAMLPVFDGTFDGQEIADELGRHSLCPAVTGFKRHIHHARTATSIHAYLLCRRCPLQLPAMAPSSTLQLSAGTHQVVFLDSLQAAGLSWRTRQKVLTKSPRSIWSIQMWAASCPTPSAGKSGWKDYRAFLRRDVESFSEEDQSCCEKHSRK